MDNGRLLCCSIFLGGVAIRPYRVYKPEKNANLPRVNWEIKVKEVRLISEDGEQLGIMAVAEAIEKAKEIDLDLVEVAPQANPPVCKLMDFGKYKYELRRKEKEARKKQKNLDMKQITMRLNIEDHDLKIKVRHAQDFLAHDHKVKFTLQLRGREIGNRDKARELFDRIVAFLGEVGKVEKTPDFGERQVHMIVAPGKIEKPGGKEDSDNAEDQD